MYLRCRVISITKKLYHPLAKNKSINPSGETVLLLGHNTLRDDPSVRFFTGNPAGKGSIRERFYVWLAFSSDLWYCLITI